jgi:hypothetical protein
MPTSRAATTRAKTPTGRLTAVAAMAVSLCLCGHARKVAVSARPDVNQPQPPIPADP